MSQPKKRKSDVHIDVCAHENPDHSHSKKEKHWFGENEPNPEGRRSSIFKGIFKKMKSSSALKSSSKIASSSKMESAANETQHSINSESSVTSTESSLMVPNVAKNAGLRTFVNRDSFTPVPPQCSDSLSDAFAMPTVGSSKQESTAKMEDSISVSSQMSVDTIGSQHFIDEDSMSVGSASAFCTPSRNPINRNPLRMSTRSVPDWNDDNGQPALFRSLCNSAVRRSQKNDGGPSTPMRRSMRMSIQKRNLTAKSMEDVPEEEALTVSNSSMRLAAPIEEEEEEEQFGYGAKEFFAAHLTNPHDESADEGQASLSRLSTSSEARKSSGSSSIGRKNSIFRKMFPGNKQQRRMSEAFEYNQESAPPSESRGRRASIVSFTNDCSFAPPESSVNPSASVSSLASNDSTQPKMRKKTPSTSNLSTVFRLSSVFRKSSNSASKEDEFAAPSNRRSTLTGFSSISSGIGSIASGCSDSGYSTFASKSGHSISRSGSKRDEENKRNRCRRLLERVVISDIPADELLKMKLEQLKKKEQREANERFETQLNESDSSTSSQNELLNFDVVAVDLKADGSPFSPTASGFIDEGIGKLVRAELPWNTRPDRCGSITECEPEMVYVCQEQAQCAQQRALNESMCSANVDLNSDFLRNVRGGLCNSIEEWKKMSASRDSSTMLIYPMFCQSEAEWDAKATIDAIFLMLDGILLSEKRWRTNGKCILAGITANNVRLLRERYDEVKQTVAMNDSEPASSYEELDTHSITSNSTVFGARL